MNSTTSFAEVDQAAQLLRGPQANGKRFAGKRVAMVTFSAYPNDPRPRRAIDALLSEGATVDLICVTGEGAPPPHTPEGVKVLRVGISNPRRGKLQYGVRYGAFILICSLVFGIRGLFRRYDLVYVHNMPDILVLCSLLPKALGAKVVLDLHDPMPELMKTIFRVPDESASVRLLKRIEKWSIGRADLAVTVNIACQRIFSSRSCQAEKIAVVMNSPDGKIFPFRVAKAQPGAGSDDSKPFIIMYHGSLVERNGLDVAIDALALVQKSIPQAELRIFGHRTAFLDQLLAEVQKRNLEGKIQYLGARRLEDLVNEIENCNLGVIPNHKNAFTEINTPTRLFEYLALGKPVVAPTTSGILDYFSEESLLFFEPGNSTDLARKIEYAAFHPRELFEIARKGQEVYMQHTWEREREILLNRLGEVLNAR